MTCIIAVKYDGKVYMGGDSAGVTGLEITTRQDSKVFTVGEMMIGYTTSFRMGQLLRYMKMPERTEKMRDDFQYMVACVIPAIRKILTDGGYTKKEHGVEKGGQFLIGYRSHIYCIHSDFQVGERIDDYDALGCGASYALGSLYGTSRLSPKNRILKALKTAAYFSAGVREPFNVVTLNTDKEKE
ncbi:hypothetical protein LCGC14_1205560 [marine sediment metagenome]|uniref:Proteasome endopeptidase complex n=1 Tax=marine sediment metagenome TaxID=412755 RepID=A0A0F9NXT7_9ZZZZ